VLSMYSQLRDDDQHLLMELRANQAEAAEALVSLFLSET
jgi:hypothetical protein